MRGVTFAIAAILIGCNGDGDDTGDDASPPTADVGDADTDTDADTDDADTDDPDTDVPTDTDDTDPDDTDTDTDTDDTQDTDDTDDTDVPPPLDSDGDGLTDDEETALGTDPFDVDTDDDLIQDGAEAGLNTDPVDDDTDDDRLLDGEEVLTWNTAPDNADTDGDLLDDGTEVLDENTDPLDTDTDDDLLDDGTEVLVEQTDPLLEDTDGGGAPDGQEVLTDGTDPLDAADDLIPLCNYPDVSVDNAAFVPALPAFDPTFIALEWQLLKDSAGAGHDFNFDVDGNGVIDPATEAFSALLIVDVFGPAGEFLCDVFMEVTNVTESDPANYASPLLEVFDVDVSGGDTVCPALDALWYGTDDIREVLASVPWAVGSGDQAAAYGTDLEDAVVAAGLDWTNDWEPFVYAGWVSFDRTVAELLSYGFAEDADCEQLLDDGAGGLVDLPVADPIPNGGRLGYDFLLFPAQLVPGLECDRADVDVGDPNWVPGGVFMEPVFVNYEVDFVPAPEGGVADVWADLDGDGIDEEVSATVTANLYDAGAAFLCSFQFDANGAVEIDPATWTSSGGALFYAWELALVDGETTDCTIIDPAIYGTDDARDLLDFSGFAIGEMNAVGPALIQTFGMATFMALRPAFFSLYVSMDGVDADEHSWAWGFVLDDCLEADLTTVYVVDPVIMDGWSVFVDSTTVFVFAL